MPRDSLAIISMSGLKTLVFVSAISILADSILCFLRGYPLHRSCWFGNPGDVDNLRHVGSGQFEKPFSPRSIRTRNVDGLDIRLERIKFIPRDHPDGLGNTRQRKLLEPLDGLQ